MPAIDEDEGLEGHTECAHQTSAFGRRAIPGARILVVDDDEDTRVLHRLILVRAGATVREAASAEVAFAALRQFCPNVIVSDIQMPGRDGYSLMRRVRSLPPEAGGRIAALALTANSEEAGRREALRAGFDMLMSKPVVAAHLIEVVATLLTALTGPQR
jgi:CheY-like chemotaxis protein